MSVLRTSDPLALRLLFADELYLIDQSPSQKVEEIVPAEKKAVETNDEAFKHSSFNYLGENNKYVLLVVNQAGSSILNAKDLESLTSILNAKKMEVRDVAILNLNKYPGTTFAMLKTFFVNTKLVLFGINPEDLQLPVIPLNRITDYLGVKILSSFSFEEMNQDPLKKRAFWNEMKVL